MDWTIEAKVLYWGTELSHHWKSMHTLGTLLTNLNLVFNNAVQFHSICPWAPQWGRPNLECQSALPSSVLHPRTPTSSGTTCRVDMCSKPAQPATCVSAHALWASHSQFYVVFLFSYVAAFNIKTLWTLIKDKTFISNDSSHQWGDLPTIARLYARYDGRALWWFHCQFNLISLAVDHNSRQPINSWVY